MSMTTIPPFYLSISLTQQTLSVVAGETIHARYLVSTALNGAGEQRGSGCTPRGWHQIRAKIGAGQPLGSVFVGRRPTGEIYSPELAAQYPARDWILTRILWLSGLEPGINRYGAVDTAWRYIYIHGSPDHLIDGTPRSHGCVRMTNQAICTLFELVPCRCPVWIGE